MPDVKIRTTEEMIKSNQLYDAYTRAQDDAEATLEDYLGDKSSRQEWAASLIGQQQAWAAWVAYLGLEE